MNLDPQATKATSSKTGTATRPAAVTIPAGPAPALPAGREPLTTSALPPPGVKAEFDDIQPAHLAVLREVVASVAGPHARIVWIQPSGEAAVSTYSRWVVQGRGQVMGSHTPHVRHAWK
ncbi:MAG: hypothetical protein SFY96_08340 [Planctomycetota bacterium]|nr:hypothetical protein [Planctomycetota bacterium]